MRTIFHLWCLFYATRTMEDLIDEQVTLTKGDFSVGDGIHPRSNKNPERLPYYTGTRHDLAWLTGQLRDT